MKKVIVISLMTCLIILGSCAMQEINIGNPTSIEPEEISMKAIRLKVFIPIDNPNNFSFKIRNVNLDLLVNGRNVGKVNKLDKVQIAAKSKDSYPVSFEITPKDALTNVLYLIGELQNRNPELEVIGTVTVSKFGVPKRIKVNHKQNLDKF